MRLSPSIFTFAQPLATVCLAQSQNESLDDWSADRVAETAGTGMPTDMMSKALDGHEDTGGSLAKLLS